jgi:hypothetical protein
MSSTIGNKSGHNGKPRSTENGAAASSRRARRQDAPATKRRNAAAKRFGDAQQRQFLELLLQGASLQVACLKLKLPLAMFWRTLEHDEQFAATLQEAWDTLSFNVMAALYQAAIKGNGPAQQFWLKHRPPPQWAAPTAPNSADELETLNDDELLDRARAEAPDLAAALAARIESPLG